MAIGILDEHGGAGLAERRVALTPTAVQHLRAAGLEVHVERGAGRSAGFEDEEYAAAGARVLARRAEVLGRSAVVLSLNWLNPEDVQAMAPGTRVLSLRWMDLAPPALRRAARGSEVIFISANRLRDATGAWPVVARMSTLAGALAPQIAARLLESTAPAGTGVLLGRLPGLPPAEVIILGAGVLGAQAARSFGAVGASVHLLDQDLGRLDALHPTLPPNVVTRLSSPAVLGQVLRFANVLVCAARDPGRRAPVLVTDDLVRHMRHGSAILDFAVDEGGNCESSRPIASVEDVYTRHGVLHFTMPHTPTLVARSASHLLSQVLLPFAEQLAGLSHPAAHRTFAPAIWFGEDEAP